MEAPAAAAKKRSAAVASDLDASPSSSLPQQTERKRSKKRIGKATSDSEPTAGPSRRSKRPKTTKKTPVDTRSADIDISANEAQDDQPSRAAAASSNASLEGPSSSTVMNATDTEIHRNLANQLFNSPPLDDITDAHEVSGELVTSAISNGVTIEDSEPLEDRVKKLEARLKSCEEALQKQSDLASSQHAVINDLQDQCTCHICLELVLRPCMLAPCGHVFCVHCLRNWFSMPLDSEARPMSNWSPTYVAGFNRQQALKRKKICPSCRTELACAPVEVWLVKDMLEKVQEGLRLKSSDVSSRSSQGGEPSDARGDQNGTDPKSDKGDKETADPRDWSDIFSGHGARRLIFDEMDRVPRCGCCTAEVFDGACSNPMCAIEYDESEFHAMELWHADDLYRDDNWSGELGDEDDIEYLVPHPWRPNHSPPLDARHRGTEELGHQHYYDEEDDSQFDYHTSDDDFIVRDDIDEEDDFLPSRRRWQNATDPVQISDDSDEDQDATRRSRANGPAASGDDDEALEGSQSDRDFDEEDSYDEDLEVDADDGLDGPDAEPSTESGRLRSRRIIVDSDDD